MSGSIFIVAVLSVLSKRLSVTCGITSSIVFSGRVIVMPSYFMIASPAVLIAFTGEYPKSAFSSNAVIAETARIIRADIKPDDHVCRWGGEEFVFLIDCADIDEGSRIAEKIRLDVENRMLEIFGKKIAFTITIGITEYVSGETVDETIARADKRMYSGKHSGKNIVVNKDMEI